MRRHIFMIDDSPADLQLARYAFEAAGLAPAQLATATGGDEALARLLTQPADHDPSLILLDLNMPVLSGAQTLQALRREDRFAMTPVVMLTTSREAGDLERCSRDGANGYVVKPGSLNGFQELARALRAFWLEANEICPPPRPRNASVEGRG